MLNLWGKTQGSREQHRSSASPQITKNPGIPDPFPKQLGHQLEKEVDVATRAKDRLGEESDMNQIEGTDPESKRRDDESVKGHIKEDKHWQSRLLASLETTEVVSTSPSLSSLFSSFSLNSVSVS